MTGSDGDERLSTEELRAIQDERENAEREMAERAPGPDAEHAHKRRADRAAYLRDKLEEQAESERE